ncbi:MAG TPA: IPT/TIG domain-containing protein [Bryobacteraceae bacterium]|nr:IPT/TIG domain-containing protein [Bryobacteraceae bacterium]
MKNLKIILGLLVAAGAATAQQYTISTIAGIGTVQGYFGDTGPATNAQLDFPFRVAVDSKGNYYIADYLTYVVREVSGGTINTIAGTATFGFQGDGDAAILAIISDIHAIAVDSSLNVYLADTHNGRIRKITPDGKIFSIAGNGTFGYAGDGGPATNAEFVLPSGVVVDSSGNVYIADYGNSTVRKVDTKGNISTIAGTGVWGFSGDGGPGAKAQLAAPYSLAIDPAGNVYIADLGNTNIREITTDGNIHTAVSNVTANSLAVDAAGSIYYPDPLTNTVQKILANGTRFAIAGTGRPGFSGDGGPGTTAQLNQPYGIALDTAGNVYVADSGNQAIRLLTPVTSSISVVNAASGLGGAIAPGEIVTIYGTNLGPATGVSAAPASDGTYGTSLSGTTVSFGGINGVMLYTSATQVSAIVPYAVGIGSTADVNVTYQGQSLTAAAIPVASSLSGIFTTNSAGFGQAAAVNQNGTINSSAAPARLGSIISVYMTGEGQTNPMGVDGKPAAQPLPQPLLPVSATMAGQQVSVAYAGGAPGNVAGLMQVNLQIPSNLVQTVAAGPVSVPVVVSVGFAPSQTNVTISVTQQ